MTWCEAHDVFYCLGLARNDRLQKHLQALFEGLKGQIRLRLFKIAARVRVRVRRIHLDLCSADPLQALFAVVHQRLRALPPAL